MNLKIIFVFLITVLSFAGCKNETISSTNILNSDSFAVFSDADPDTPEEVSNLVGLIQTAFRDSENGKIGFGIGCLGNVGDEYSYDNNGQCCLLNPNVQGMIIPDNITYLEFEYFAPSDQNGCSSIYLQEYRNQNPNKYFPAKIYRINKSANVLGYTLQGYESNDEGGYVIPVSDRNSTATYTLVQTWELKKR